MRKLYEQNIKKETTEIFYPNEMTLDEFVAFIKENIDTFHSNMNELSKQQLSSQNTDSKFIEKWFEQYLNWCDVEQER